MSRLAAGAEALRPHYDAIVVGSGYGGGIAASRLARMGLSVAVLERGREVLPGEFPTGVLAAERETQLGFPGHRIGAAQAIFDVRVGRGAHILMGCGLGGTSLINANVCLEPDPRVLADPMWPDAIRADGMLAEGYRRARAVLDPKPLPPGDAPRKLDALAVSAKALGASHGRVDLHIAFDQRVNGAGVLQPACTRCGDCLGGCNAGAKTTVHSTYLADAANHGAQLFTGMLVRHVERTADKRWRVVFQFADGKARRMPVRSLTAEAVILAAGTLGTNEILLRSRERGLALSDRLGRGVSTNGDAISLGYNTRMPVGSVGVGHPPPPDAVLPGPAVAGLIDLRGVPDVRDGLVVVDASVQSAFAALMPLAMAAGGLFGDSEGRSVRDIIAAAGRVATSAVLGPQAGAVENTQVLLTVGHDAAAGEITLENDRAVLVWPHATDAPVYRHIDEVVGRAVAATGGTYVPNPISKRWLGGNVFSVHPLGGAKTARDRTGGVIDHKGRVFDGSTAAGGTDVHLGLYVVDGAAIPGSLGVHPLLTISAFAERAMLHLAKDIGRTFDIEPKAEAPERAFHLFARSARSAKETVPIPAPA